jgi:hypothetical protein
VMYWGSLFMLTVGPVARATVVSAVCTMVSLLY